MPTVKYVSGEANRSRIGGNWLRASLALLILGTVAVAWTESDQAEVKPAGPNHVGMMSVHLQCHGLFEGVDSIGYDPLRSNQAIEFSTRCATLVGPWLRTDSPVALKPVSGQLLVPANDADISVACANGESPTFVVDTVGSQTTVSASCPTSSIVTAETHAWQPLQEPAQP